MAIHIFDVVQTGVERKSLILITLRKLIWFGRHWLNIFIHMFVDIKFVLGNKCESPQNRSHVAFMGNGCTLREGPFLNSVPYWKLSLEANSFLL